MSDKVLIVLTSLVAEGCPQLALQLTRYWRKQGIQVELVCLQALPIDLWPEFESLGISTYVFSLGSGLARYPRLALLSYRLCRKLKPRAVLSFPLGWHTFIALGARLSGVRRVCAHVGNLPPVWTGLAFTKFKLMIQVGRYFTYSLLCCSDYIRDATIRDFGISPRQARSVFNACDLQQFVAVERSAVWPHRPARLGMVARLEQHKDQPSLIRAFALLHKQAIAADLWLIGEGTQRPQLEMLIAELQLEQQVQLLGSRRDIPALLSQLDLFVFSARPDEGFGIALAEAMAAGVPVVATDVGACREVLEGGRCGLLVEPNSPQALADGIRQALEDPEATRQRAAAARERALRDFSVEAMAQAYGEELGIS